MKKFNRILLVLVLGYSCFSAAILIRILHDYSFFYPVNGHWKLVWEDDFNGPMLDQNKWSPVMQCVNPRQEQQVFLQENVSVRNGCLILASKKEDWTGTDKLHPDQVVTRNYTSGEVGTWEKAVWKYGRFEIRAKLPAGQGVSSYVVLYPNDDTWPPEIHIMVMRGDQPDKIYFANYWGADAKHQRSDNSGPVSVNDYMVNDFSAGFHTFTLEWSPRKLQWYIDDIPKYQVTRNIPDKPLCFVLGTAVGGVFCGDPYDPKFRGIPSSFPQYLIIDWVRVFQRR
ncbi:MAG TPA: glycoside hydrolase family 16 protein [Bacillota bacterium]